MSRNISQVYTDNPSTTLAADDLLYLGLTPYGATDDSAIKWSDVQDEIISASSANEVLFNNAGSLDGVSTANNGLLLTSAAGVPSIGNAVLADTSFNTVTVGLGDAGVSTNVRCGINVLDNASTTGANNVAVGENLLGALTTGPRNIAIGGDTLLAVTTGNNNVMIGTDIAPVLVGGSNNVGIGGRNTLKLITSGSNNFAFGVGSGQGNPAGSTGLTTGSSNFMAGTNSATSTADATGTIAIGANAIGNGSTGATSSDHGPGISLGATAFKVGFRGDGTIYPSAGASAGYWRPKINGTIYKIELLADT